MKSVLVFFLLIICSHLCFGQQHGSKRKTGHKFSVHVSGLKNFNKNTSADIEHWTQINAASTPQFLSVNNTYGFQAGIGYEYVNKKRQLLCATISFGNAMQDYRWNFTFKTFDTAKAIYNAKDSYSNKASTPYLLLMLAAGQDFAPFKNSAYKIQAKAGIGIMYYLRAFNEKSYHFIAAQAPVNDTLYGKVYAVTNINNTEKLGFIYDFYLGIAKDMHSGFIKEYRLGLSFTHAFGFFKRNNDFTTSAFGTYYNSKGELLGGDSYSNRFRNVALRLSIVF